jgi:hypothetical protein
VVLPWLFRTRCSRGGNLAQKKTRSEIVYFSFLKNKNATMITDGKEPLSFAEESVDATMKKQIDMQPNGGFVLVLE